MSVPEHTAGTTPEQNRGQVRSDGNTAPTSNSDPTAPTPRADRRAKRLAEAFAREPELVLACLQAAPRGSAQDARVVLAAARAALRQQPRYADLQYHASHAAIACGEYDTAAALLTGALQVNPGYKDALILAARVALLRGKVSAARSYLLTAISQGAVYPDVYVLLGDVWRQEKDFTRARAAYERALELNPNLAPASAALTRLLSETTGEVSDELPA
jgi:tetratricopeptide (TPR) repeat protein